MHAYIFIDLDDTLFQTLRKLKPGYNPAELVARALLADGRENSFATPKQQWLWQWLSRDFKIVPVTARDGGAFQRVLLSFTEEAVLNHGAVILDKHGQVDAEWQQQMQAERAHWQAKLHALWQVILAYCENFPDYKPRLVDDYGETWFAVVKHRSGDEAPLRQLLDDCLLNHPALTDGSFYWHLNSNNLAILPDAIRKERAVAFLLDRYQQQAGEIFSIGAGDSLTDVPFLALCDYALIPSNTQLFKALSLL